jgi:hypothetical protein
VSELLVTVIDVTAESAEVVAWPSAVRVRLVPSLERLTSVPETVTGAGAAAVVVVVVVVVVVSVTGGVVAAAGSGAGGVVSVAGGVVSVTGGVAAAAGSGAGGACVSFIGVGAVAGATPLPSVSTRPCVPAVVSDAVVSVVVATGVESAGA